MDINRIEFIQNDNFVNLFLCDSQKRTRSNNKLVTMITTILNCTSEEIEVDNTYTINGANRSKPLISLSKRDI